VGEDVGRDQSLVNGIAGESQGKDLGEGCFTANKPASPIAPRALPHASPYKASLQHRAQRGIVVHRQSLEIDMLGIVNQGT
jgi:hypothetical protein